jgi:ABC-type branched-subunit amino acid transport system substrate-binding protein
MRGKLVTAAGLSLLLLTATAACGGNDQDGADGASSSKPIQIGMDLDLSGPFSIGGQGTRKGIEAYFNAVNKSGGIAGRQVRLITLDSAADVNRALSNVQQLISQDRVDALLGVSVSSISEALDGVVTDAKIPLVSVAAAPSQIFPKPSDWVVMAQSVQNQQVGPTVELIQKLVPGTPKVAYIHFDSAAQHGFGDGLTKAIQQHNWTLSAKEIVPLTAAPDVRAQASKLVAAHPDVVVSLMTDKNAKLLEETLRVQGFKGPIIQNPDTGPDILSKMKDDPDFYLMTHSYIDNTASDQIGGDDNWARMKDAFAAANLPIGTAYAVRGYLNALVLGTALGKCGGCTGEELRTTLIGETVPANGITPGDLSFSADNHQGVKGVPIYRYVNGAVTHVGDFKTGTGLTG